MAAVTLTEVARRAGVSPATASRVLNGSERKPAAEIAERVRAAAESLGYIPNAQAQALARSSSGLVGLVVNDIADPYFSSIARGVQGAAREHRRTVLLIGTAGGPAEERRAVEAFAARRTDAIVIAGSRSDRPQDAADNEALSRETARYLANGGRVALIGHPFPGEQDPAVRVIAVPNRDLSRELGRRLGGEPFDDFIVVAGGSGLVTSDLRTEGFQEGLADAGRPPAGMVRTGFDRDGGFAAAPEVAAAVRAAHDAGRRTCAFAVNDRMAIGLVAGLREEGLRVPHDLGVAGFDDIETLRDFRPALTTVRLPLEEMGRLAVETALGDARPVEVAGTVVQRRSTEVPADS